MALTSIKQTINKAGHLFKEGSWEQVIKFFEAISENSIPLQVFLENFKLINKLFIIKLMEAQNLDLNFPKSSSDLMKSKSNQPVFVRIFFIFNFFFRSKLKIFSKKNIDF